MLKKRALPLASDPAERLTLQPIADEFDQAGEDQKDLDLQAQNPHRPPGRRRRRGVAEQQRIEREASFGWKGAKNGGKQQDQIVLVQIGRLLQQEHVGEA